MGRVGEGDIGEGKGKEGEPKKKKKREGFIKRTEALGKILRD